MSLSVLPLNKNVDGEETTVTLKISGKTPYVDAICDVLHTATLEINKRTAQGTVVKDVYIEDGD
jgi:hypothetical protein